MKRIPDTYVNNLGLALFGLEVVEAVMAKRQWGDATEYARHTRAFLDRAERAARREARATLKPLRVRSTKGGAA